ncbi:hypothetical protein BKI51_05060 [Alphaproteobacteria bacterium AO1-B]|nr:hypothetical protein BKI51_05060 [Alphaproteobacteria bacterium AO1-B]
MGDALSIAFAIDPKKASLACQHISTVSGPPAHRQNRVKTILVSATLPAQKFGNDELLFLMRLADRARKTPDQARCARMGETIVRRWVGLRARRRTLAT